MHTKKKKTERKLDKQERNYDVQILKLYQIRPIFKIQCKIVDDFVLSMHYAKKIRFLQSLYLLFS